MTNFNLKIISELPNNTWEVEDKNKLLAKKVACIIKVIEKLTLSGGEKIITKASYPVDKTGTPYYLTETLSLKGFVFNKVYFDNDEEWELEVGKSYWVMARRTSEEELLIDENDLAFLNEREDHINNKMLFISSDETYSNDLFLIKEEWEIYIHGFRIANLDEEEKAKLKVGNTVELTYLEFEDGYSTEDPVVVDYLFQKKRILDLKTAKFKIIKNKNFKYKLREQEAELEKFIQEQGINREKVWDLRKTYQKLIQFYENYNQGNIDEAREGIEKIKGELLQGGWFTKKVSVDNVQKLCRDCEKVAKLAIEKDKFYQGQYQAQQEAPPR